MVSLSHHNESTLVYYHLHSAPAHYINACVSEYKKSTPLLLLSCPVLLKIIIAAAIVTIHVPKTAHHLLRQYGTGYI